MLQVIGLASLAVASTRGWAANSIIDSRIRLKAHLDQARHEIAMLREEIRIKDARMARISPVVPIGGFWTAWIPFSLPQCWPFCHWAATVADHFSRCVIGNSAFKSQPTSHAVWAFLGQWSSTRSDGGVPIPMCRPAQSGGSGPLAQVNSARRPRLRPMPNSGVYR